MEHVAPGRRLSLTDTMNSFAKLMRIGWSSGASRQSFGNLGGSTITHDLTQQLSYKDETFLLFTVLHLAWLIRDLKKHSNSKRTTIDSKSERSRCSGSENLTNIAFVRELQALIRRYELVISQNDKYAV